MYEELIKALRTTVMLYEAVGQEDSVTTQLMNKAADAIEELSKQVELEHLSGFSDEQVDTIVKAFEPTTKDDLGFDAVSRKDVHDMLENLPVTVEDKWFNWLQKACMRLADLPPVTPIDERIALAMLAGARAIEQSPRKYLGTIFVYEPFGINTKEITYCEAAKKLRETAEAALKGETR